MTRSGIFGFFLHLTGWVFFYSMVLAFISADQPGREPVSLFGPDFLLFYFVFPFIFYCNLFALIPGLFHKKYYVLYFLCFVLFFFLVFWLKPFDHIMRHSEMNQRPPPPPLGDRKFMPPPSRQQRFDIMSTILFLMVWLFSSAIYVFQQWRSSEQRAFQAEADKAIAELSFLKAQVNPHFLFNTLNNIYSLAVTKSEHTAASIMKLSNIMRYVTDGAREDVVLLTEEIECMRDYIDLQRLRTGSNTEVIFDVSGDVSQKQVAPLLFMSFIENAFKYGVSNHEPSTIVIRLSADVKTIHFKIRNKLFETKSTMERTGIGQANALQRLERLYHNRHSIEITAKDGFYTVQLTLQP